MTDELFRWVVAVGVALACFAMVAQAIVLLKLYGTVQKVNKETVEPLIGKISPVISKIEPTLDRVGDVLERVGPALEKAGPLFDKAVPVIESIGPMVQSIGKVSDKTGVLISSVNQVVDENRPKVREISGEAVAIMKTGHDQVERVGELLQDAAGRARVRMEQIDRSVETTVQQVEQVGASVRSAIMRPVREVNGVAAGLSAAMSALSRKKSQVDSATQDEEMFI